MINYLKKKIYNIYINYAYKKIIDSSKIKKFKTNEINEDLKIVYEKLNNNGIIQYNGIKINDNSINYYLKKIEKKINTKNIFNKYPFFSEKIVFENNTLVEKVLKDKQVNSLIKCYLGEDAKLDYISLMITKANTSNKIVSEKWHYDNVGKRLKMFVYLNDSNYISTEYIKETNNLKHFFYSTEGSRVNENKIKKLKKNKATFFAEKGKILIFDTNGFHRGNFQLIQNQIKNESNQFRILIKFEYSSKLKSERFYDKSDIIGPRSTFFSEDFNVNDCELIDKSCLSKVGQIFFYDRRYALNI